MAYSITSQRQPHPRDRSSILSNTRAILQRNSTSKSLWSVDFTVDTVAG